MVLLVQIVESLLTLLGPNSPPSARPSLVVPLKNPARAASLSPSSSPQLRLCPSASLLAAAESLHLPSCWLTHLNRPLPSSSQCDLSKHSPESFPKGLPSQPNALQLLTRALSSRPAASPLRSLLPFLLPKRCVRPRGCHLQRSLCLELMPMMSGSLFLRLSPSERPSQTDHSSPGEWAWVSCLLLSRLQQTHACGPELGLVPGRAPDTWRALGSINTCPVNEVGSSAISPPAPFPCCSLSESPATQSFGPPGLVLVSVIFGLFCLCFLSASPTPASGRFPQLLFQCFSTFYLVF